MNRKQLLAELRRLFAEEKRVQWTIGDLLVREVGPAGNDHAHNGAMDQLEEIANDLGVSIAALLKYRRLASTFPDDTRVSTVSFSAHEAASTASDPAKVIAEAKKRADQRGEKVTVPLVREIAARYPKPNAAPSHRRELREAPGGWSTDFISAMDGSTNNLRRVVTMLQAMGPNEELTHGTERMLVKAMDRCEEHIAWIRAYVRGESVVDEAAEFLQTQG